MATLDSIAPPPGFVEDDVPTPPGFIEDVSPPEGFVLDEEAPAQPSVIGEARAASVDFQKRVAASATQATMHIGRALMYLDEKVNPLVGLTKMALGPADPLDLMRKEVVRFATDVQEAAPAELGVDPAREGTWPSKIAAGAGTVLPILASGPAAPFTAAALMGESQREEAEAAGAGEGKQAAAFGAGAAIGAISEATLGLPALLRSAKAVATTGKTAVREVIEQVGKGTVRESGQESLEQIGSNITAKAIYDPERGVLEGVPEAAVVGAAIGGPLGGVVQGAASADARATQALASDLERDIAALGLEPVEQVAPEVAAPTADELPPATDSVIELEPAPADTIPTLRQGENQGDLLAKQTEDLRLVGEKGPDTVGEAEARVIAERESAEAQAKQDREQTDLFRDEGVDEETRYRSEALAEYEDTQEQTNYELLDSIKSLGGLPALSAKGKEATGELRRIIESSPNLKANQMNLFRKTGKSLDTLREELNDRGFDFETPYDMLTAIEQSLTSGKKIFGQRAPAVAGAKPPIMPGASQLTPRTPSVPVAPVKAVSQIIRDLAKGAGLPIRFGRLTTNRFSGYFKAVANLIGAKSANDLPVVAHEIGHKLDAAFDISSDPGISWELNILGDPSTSGSRSSWTKSKTHAYKQGEGVGEFVRYWLTDPATASRMAPKTEKYFEQVMDANPDFGDVMRQARQDIENWRNAPAEARLDSSISVGENPNGTRYRLSQLTRDMVDDLHMLKLAVNDAAKSGTDLKPSENPYVLARLLRGSYGMADTFIRSGVVDFTTKQVALGTSLEDALKPVAGRIDAFRRWIVAKRAQELRTQGRETGLVSADVDFVANKYGSEPAFQKAFDDLKKWSDGLLQYAVDSGYVSTESADAMRAMNADYVPFHRVFEIGAGEDPSVSSTGTGGRGLNVGKVGSVKRLTGSQRDIVDPLETLVKNAYVLVTASEKSAINAAIGGLANRKDMGKWVEQIATPKESVRVVVEKLRDQLTAAGANMDKVPDDLVLQFFQNSNQAPWGENVIKVTQQGQTTFYRLKADLFDAFHALDLEDSSRIMQILAQPTQWLRSGVTLTPDFALANLMRDAFSSAVINRYGMLPFEGAVRGVAAMIKNPKLVAEWSASGAAQSMEANFFDRKKLSAFMRERITKDLTPAEQALVIVKSPLIALRWLTGTFESATRIGEYQKSFNQAIKAGMPEGEARRLAAFESRDRQDFAKGGAKTKIVRQLAAFWNAQMQANVSLINAFKNRPVRTMLQGVAFVTVPKLIEQAVNWDDDDYWDRPQWERDLFFLIPIDKDENKRTRFLRIPTPFEAGLIFGTVPGRMLQWARGKGEGLKNLPSTILRGTIPNPIPQSVQVLYANFLSGPQGWDVWRGRPVVPEHTADLPAELQWTEQTSLTARKVGKAIGVSPMKVDNIISGTTGGLGRQLTHNAIDRMISAATGEKRTAANAAPGMRFFSTPAGISSQAVEDFYAERTRLTAEKARAKASGTTNQTAARLAKFEAAGDRMAALRKQAKAEKDAAKKQAHYLKIVSEAKAALR